MCLVTEQLKQFRGQQKPSPMGTQTTAPPPPPPPPLPPPKESFARRYKFVWPMLLAVNLAVGGHFSSPHQHKIEKVFFFLSDLMFFFSIVGDDVGTCEMGF